MQLKRMEIHNFRSVITASIEFDAYALIVGANNCGKSTVIDCLRAFYEKDGYKFKKDVDFPFKEAKDEESWVDLTFKLTAEEHDSLKDEYKTGDQLLKVRKYFLTEQKLHDGKTAAGTILGFKSDGSFSDEPFYGARNVQNGKFGELIYIPAISKVDEHTKLTGPSPLRDLITNIMSDVLNDSEDYKTFAENVGAFSDAVWESETADKRSLAGFESDLNNLLGPWQTNFKLKLSTPSPAEIIKSLLGYEIRDSHHGKTQGVEYFGSGFQRHLIFSLIQLGAKYLPRKAAKKTKDFTPSMNLLLFEEPEAFLHPPQQEELARGLVGMSKTEDWQVVCTTHSAHFVSRNAARIPAIIRLRKTDGLASAFQLNDEDWQSLIEDNQTVNELLEKAGKTIHEDDWKAEMEALKYFLWINPDRAGMLFAQTVLLVEGPSETALINRLRDDGEVTLPPGAYVMDGLGKHNLHRFMNLLSKLGADHAVLHDDDENNNEHKALNQLIRDARTEFTRAIVPIPGDLEALLGVELVKQHRRKPQHLLYRYDSNGIDGGKLAEFCGLVNSCFAASDSNKEEQSRPFVDDKVQAATLD